MASLKLTNNLTVGGKTPIYITEEAGTYANWYRKWSDGTIEQGGQLTCTSSSDRTITYYTPFADTNYQVFVSVLFAEGSPSSALHWAYVYSKSTSTATVYHGWTSISGTGGDHSGDITIQYHAIRYAGT